MILPNQPNNVSLYSRIKGGIFGTAIGDALGVPVEFLKRNVIAPNPVTGMRGWGTHNQPPGTWSDDTSMALCVLESINKKGWSIDDQAVRFVRWLGKAHLTAHDEVFDAGRATAQAIERISDGWEPLEAGCFEEDSNGNGSLMRNLPGAVYCTTLLSDAETVQNISDSSAITHAHARSRLGCVIHAFLVSGLLKGMRIDEANINAAEKTESVLSTSSLFADMRQELPRYHFILHDNLELADISEIKATGYVVDTLEAAVWCLLTSQSFEECVLKAVNLGEDTDTVGAVAGGLAGIYWGYESIPSEWVDALAKQEMIGSMTDEFNTVLESSGASSLTDGGIK